MQANSIDRRIPLLQHRPRREATNDRLQRRVALLLEEHRIKHVRMERVPAAPAPLPPRTATEADNDTGEEREAA
jgi:hypothetical protein